MVVVRHGSRSKRADELHLASCKFLLEISSKSIAIAAAGTSDNAGSQRKNSESDALGNIILYDRRIRINIQVLNNSGYRLAVS